MSHAGRSGIPTALLAALLAAAPALAQDDASREVAALRTDFEFGKYEEVLARAQTLLDQGAVEAADDLVELHKLAGVSAFNLGRSEAAERHLTAMLRLDPDYALDPFVFPPPVIEFVDRLRKQLAPELQRLREMRELAEARRRAAEAEAERIRAEQERRRLEALPRRTTIRTIEHRSYFVNFVPFGAGQFQQGRHTPGILLAGTQGALAATSIVAFWAHEAIIETKTITVPNVLGGTYELEVRGIPASRVQEAQNWRLIKTISALGFYGMYAFGLLDALLHHQDAIESTQTLEEPPGAPPGQGAPTLNRSAAPPPPTVIPFVFPVPGGAGAGIHVLF